MKTDYFRHVKIEIKDSLNGEDEEPRTDGKYDA